MDQEVEQRRQKDLLISCIAIMLGCLYLGLHIGYCMLMCSDAEGKVDLAAFSDLIQKNILNPFQFMPFQSSAVVLAMIIGALVCLKKYNDYIKKKDTMPGKEHGSASFNIDWNGLLRGYIMSPKMLSKHFKKKYETVPAPGGRKLCKKKKFKAPEIAYCRLQSQIYSKQVALSLDTSLTQLNLNAIIFGGSGAGKSRFFVMPNLLQANSSYVVTDPSGELMSGTAKFLESQGYTIKCLNLEHMDESCRYNPFAYVYEDADLLVMVKALTENIEGPKKGGGGDNKFWDETSETLLVALCGYLFEVCKDDNEYLYEYETNAEGNTICDENGNPIVKKDADGNPVYKLRHKTDIHGKPLVDQNGNAIMEKCPNAHWKGCRNFTNVLNLLNMADVSDDRQVDKDDLDKLFDDLEKSNPSSYAVSQYKVIKQAGTGKTAQNIIISTSAIFARFFQLDKINNLTYRDEIHLEELGQKKCALFIVTPQGDTTYNFLASMLYTQLFATLYHQGEMNAKTRHTTSVKLDVPVRCLIDEAANVGVIPQFAEKLATMRKYGISCCPIYQNQAQVKALFKDNWETIVGNCDTMLFLGGIDSSTVKTVSERLGKGTIYADTQSHNLDKKGGGNESRQILGRELMTTTEIEQMKNDHCICFIRSMKPWYDYKYPLEKHPNYKYSGMADSKNAYIAPWHLDFDRDLLRRIAVRKTGDPDYIAPQRASWVTDAEVKRAERDAAEKESAAPAQNPDEADVIDLNKFSANNPDIKFTRAEDDDFAMEQYEDDQDMDDVMTENLKKTDFGRKLLETTGRIERADDDAELNEYEEKLKKEMGVDADSSGVEKRRGRKRVGKMDAKPDDDDSEAEEKPGAKQRSGSDANADEDSDMNPDDDDSEADGTDDAGYGEYDPESDMPDGDFTDDDAPF